MLLGRTQEQSLALLEMITALLDMNRLEAGRLPVQRARLSVAQLLEEVCQQLPEGWRRPEVQLRRALAPGLPEIESDAGKLDGAAVAGLNGGTAAPRLGQLFADERPSAIPVDTELVLAVDVSYSMDPEEQQLQREGYIAALTSVEFMQALTKSPVLYNLLDESMTPRELFHSGLGQRTGRNPFP